MPRKTKTEKEGFSIVMGALCCEGVFQCEMCESVFEDMLDDKHTKVIRLVSLSSDYFEEIWNGSDYVRQAIKIEMTIRKEVRCGRAHWYAYRRKGGILSKRYLGQTDKITPYLLADVARKMP